MDHENLQLRRTISLLLGQKDIVALVTTVFVLERDPYKIWKVLQDVAGGNKYFFKIFEAQKRQYGINYSEIDELIGKS